MASLEPTFYSKSCILLATCAKRKTLESSQMGSCILARILTLGRWPHVLSPMDLRWMKYTITSQVFAPVACCVYTAFLTPTLNWYRVGPRGAPGHKNPFCDPHFLTIENRLHSASKTFPSFQRAGSAPNQGREEMQRHGRINQETIVQPWVRVLVPPQGIHRTVFLSCFADTEMKPPTRWEKLTVCCPSACRPQTGWNQKVDDADSHLPHHQPIRRKSTRWSHPPLWKITIKLIISSRWGHTVLRALAHGGPLA